MKCNRPGCKNDLDHRDHKTIKKDGSLRKIRMDKRYCSSKCAEHVWISKYRPKVKEIRKMLGEGA